MKKIIITICLAIFTFLLHSQTLPVQHRLNATNENEMYKIYEQLLDSALTSKNTLISFYFGSIENPDTLMKIEQYCYWYRGYPEQYICEQNRYSISLSISMPIAFYENFLEYLKALGNNDNIFNKYYSVYPLYRIKDILINQYETNKLNKEDSLKALKLIEEITLRIILDGYHYQFLYGSNKYITEKIHQALIETIKHPFYPESYLDFYMNKVVDTTCLDTMGIPNNVKIKYEKWGYVADKEENKKYDSRLSNFYYYKKLGDEFGISPGQAFLKEKKEAFPEQGYLNINIIADYAIKYQDSELISKLKDFKMLHPDYPLKGL